MADNGRSLADRACAPDGVEPAAPSQAKPLVPIAGTLATALTMDRVAELRQPDWRKIVEEIKNG